MAKIITTKALREIAKLQCTRGEAAAFLGISRRALITLLQDERGKRAWDEGRELGKVSLRRKQFRLAGTSTPMAIHLGKQYLEQQDKVSHELTGKDGGPVETVDLSNLNVEERKQLRGILTRAIATNRAS